MYIYIYIYIYIFQLLMPKPNPSAFQNITGVGELILAWTILARGSSRCDAGGGVCERCQIGSP